MGVQVGGAPAATPSTLVNDTIYATGSGSVAVSVSSSCLFIPPLLYFYADARLTNVIAHGDGYELQTSANSSGCTAPGSVLTVDHSNYNSTQAKNGPITDAGGNQTAPSLTNPASLFVFPPTDLHERAGASTIDAGTSAGIEGTDLDGNPRAQGRAPDMGAYESTPPPPGPTPKPAPIPSLSRLTLSPKQFSSTGRLLKGKCVARTRANARHRHCRLALVLRLSYTLNTPASLRLTLRRLTTGRKNGRRCVKTNKRNRKHGHCTLYQAVRRASTTGRAGTNTALLRLGKLGPGSYQLLITPAAGTHNGSTRNLGLTVTG